jgi:hypothetical protein
MGKAENQTCTSELAATLRETPEAQMEGLNQYTPDFIDAQAKALYESSDLVPNSIVRIWNEAKDLSALNNGDFNRYVSFSSSLRQIPTNDVALEDFPALKTVFKSNHIGNSLPSVLEAESESACNFLLSFRPQIYFSEWLKASGLNQNPLLTEFYSALQADDYGLIHQTRKKFLERILPDRINPVIFNNLFETDYIPKTLPDALKVGQEASFEAEINYLMQMRAVSFQALLTDQKGQQVDFKKLNKPEFQDDAAKRISVRCWQERQLINGLQIQRIKNLLDKNTISQQSEEFSVAGKSYIQERIRRGFPIQTEWLLLKAAQSNCSQ